MARGEELTFIQKRFLVQRLACFEAPSAVAKAFKEEFGFELQLNRVTYYDPTTKAGAALLADLKAIFEETRAKYLTDLDSIPIANKAYRLHHLQRQLNFFAAKNAGPIVLAILEAGAKEVGDAFTNRHKHQVSGAIGTYDLTNATDDELATLEPILRRLANPATGPD